MAKKRTRKDASDHSNVIGPAAFILFWVGIIASTVFTYAIPSSGWAVFAYITVLVTAIPAARHYPRLPWL